MTNNKQQTAVEWLIEQFYNNVGMLTSKKLLKAKEMENEKHEKFNKFLNDEKQLGISDVKTIERIQWYYNTYFNETYGGGEQ
jgi:hypothetical protein